MIRRLILLLLTIITVSVSLMGAGGFQLIGQWDHGDQGPLDGIWLNLIDKDNHVVISFGKSGKRIISADKVISFAPFGQGPDELTICMGVCHFNDDLAFIEMGQKVKIFTKRDNTYKWKETRWLKQSLYPHFFSHYIFFKNKWFVSGLKPVEPAGATLTSRIDTTPYKVDLVKVYNDKGEPLTTLIHKEYPEMNRYHLMYYYLAVHRSNVFLIAENELKVYEISPDTLKVVKETSLEVPAFYKKMPGDFYILRKTDTDSEYKKNLEHWKTSYSRITQAVVEDGYLVLQIRTFHDKKNKFAMLFYNADTLKLEKIVPIDDFFINARNGKYYFFAHGNPGRDEDAEENLIINIYSIKGKL